MVAEQLGSTIRARCSKHEAAVAKLAELHARGKQVRNTRRLVGLLVCVTAEAKYHTSSRRASTQNDRPLLLFGVIHEIWGRKTPNDAMRVTCRMADFRRRSRATNTAPGSKHRHGQAEARLRFHTALSQYVFATTTLKKGSIYVPPVASVVRGPQAKGLKLDRKIDFRRRLAAAADEARQETETVALRRRLLRGETSRGADGVYGDGASAAVGRAGTVRAAPTAGHDLSDESKWEEDGVLQKPDAAATAAEAAGAASALSLARWNQQQEEEQAQELRELMAEMKDAIDGGAVDGAGRRPTFRRSSSGGSSRSASTSGRGSISGSGTWNPAGPLHPAIPNSFYRLCSSFGCATNSRWKTLGKRENNSCH